MQLQQQRHIYAARAPPLPAARQQGPPLSRSGSQRRGRAGSDEDVRSAVYPTMSEWCSMQQELVDRGGFSGADMHEDVFSDGASDVAPLACEAARRPSLGVPRLQTAPPAHRYRDQSCSGRVEGGTRPWGALNGAPPATARERVGGSGYYRRGAHAAVSGQLAGKAGPERRSSSLGPRCAGAPEPAERDVDRRAPGGVAKLKHMFETTRMSRIGGFGGSTKVHHMVQRYEGGTVPE